jgi:CHRD domain
MGRRVLVALLVVATIGLVTTVAVAGHGGFHASLQGFDEVPAVSTTGTGTFEATLDTVRGHVVIRYVLQYSGLEGTAMAAHIHFGQPDVNGGVSAFLCGGGDKPACPPSGVVRGVVDRADVIGPEGQGIAPGEIEELIAAMEAGMSYVNVHTDKHPSGEIRGQVEPD